MLRCNRGCGGVIWGIEVTANARCPQCGGTTLRADDEVPVYVEYLERLRVQLDPKANHFGLKDLADAWAALKPIPDAYVQFMFKMTRGELEVLARNALNTVGLPF